MKKQPRQEVVWVVVRLDLYQGDLSPDHPQSVITLREAVPTPEEAEAEADRLNALNAEKGVRYYAAPVRFYPEGRNVEIGY